jgi:hypothetical protein
MKMFIGMSKREILKSVEGKKVEILYAESSHKIPKTMLLKFEEGQGRYRKKHFYLRFDKNSRRIITEW